MHFPNITLYIKQQNNKDTFFLIDECTYDV